MQDFYFVGATCTQDYLSKHYGLKYSMFSTGAMILDDFMFLIENRDKLKYEMGTRGNWKDSKPTKQCYFWRNWNNQRGICTEKTFSIEYGFEGTDRTIEILYRHYPFTVENFFKVRKRVRR